jgi:hypothetical protein
LRFAHLPTPADTGATTYCCTSSARNALQWAHEMGASTLGEALELLDQLEVSNDVPELLGQEDTVEDVRQEFELGVDLVGADTLLTSLL